MIKDKLISVISNSSDHYGNKLIEFMNRYKLNNLAEATPKQLKEFIKQEGLKNEY